jgi:hypothetical protein
MIYLLNNRSCLHLPQSRFLPIITNVKYGINQFEIESHYICTSTLKAFENYFIMNTTTPHERKSMSEVVYHATQMLVKCGILSIL